MFEKKLKHIEINGVEYPYKCTIGVIERMQERYGTIQNFEMELKFKGQKRDRENLEIEIGLGALSYFLSEMITEGISIEGTEMEPLTEAEIKAYAGDEYGILELFTLASEEFSRCFSTKKNGKTTQRTVTKK